jgi:hypothetical protein
MLLLCRCKRKQAAAHRSSGTHRATPPCTRCSRPGQLSLWCSERKSLCIARGINDSLLIPFKPLLRRLSCCLCERRRHRRPFKEDSIWWCPAILAALTAGIRRCCRQWQQCCARSALRCEMSTSSEVIQTEPSHVQRIAARAACSIAVHNATAANTAHKSGCRNDP